MKELVKRKYTHLVLDIILSDAAHWKLFLISEEFIPG
jgi:hypothetical protein